MHGSDRDLAWIDYERALVGTGNCFSTRAKWRALRSAQSSTLKKCLTPPTLSERRVESRTGAVTVVSRWIIELAFASSPQSGLTWFWFLFPLIEPDRQISRIRLSEKTHVILCDAVCNFWTQPGVARLVVNPHVLRRFLRPSLTEVPSLYRNYSVSSVLRTSPPPHTARPVSHELPVDPY